MLGENHAGGGGVAFHALGADFDVIYVEVSVFYGVVGNGYWLVGLLSVALAVPEVAGLVELPEGVLFRQDEVVEGLVRLSWRGGAGGQPFEVGKEPGVVGVGELHPLLGGAGSGGGGVGFGAIATTTTAGFLATSTEGAACHLLRTVQGEIRLLMVKGIDDIDIDDYTDALQQLCEWAADTLYAPCLAITDHADEDTITNLAALQCNRVAVVNSCYYEATGNVSHEGSLTVLRSEYQALRDAGGGTILDMQVDITISYGDPAKGDVMKTDKLIGVEFTEEPDSFSQGDKNSEHQLPFIFLRKK